VAGIAYSNLTGLQEAAIRALAGLACIDADLVWLLLADVYYSLNQREPLLPNQDLALVWDLLLPPMSLREYLFVQYGGEGVRCDVDPSSVHEVFRRMQDVWSCVTWKSGRVHSFPTILMFLILCLSVTLLSFFLFFWVMLAAQWT
jgi:hypothetical protein